jgi:phage baseplate assembly protein W
MSGLAVKLPITRDNNDGFRLLKTYEDLAVQNLKMLILTSPGERMMDPEFGAGAKNLLFEQMTLTTFDDFESNLLDQVNRYMPYLVIQDIAFDSALTNPNLDENYLSITVSFFNRALNTRNLLRLPINI